MCCRNSSSLLVPLCPPLHTTTHHLSSSQSASLTAQSLHHLHIGSSLGQSIKLNPCLSWLTNGWWAHIVMELFFYILIKAFWSCWCRESGEGIETEVSAHLLVSFPPCWRWFSLSYLSSPSLLPLHFSVWKWIANQAANWVTVSERSGLIVHSESLERTRSLLIHFCLWLLNLQAATAPCASKIYFS